MIFATTVALAAGIALFLLGMKFVYTAHLAPVHSNRVQSMSAFYAGLRGVQSPQYEYYS